MDVKELNEIIIREKSVLSELLELLEEQHDLLIKNELIKLEEIVGRIDLCNKEIAKAELERRRLVDGDSMKTIIENSRDENLDKSYREVKKLLHALGVQKETNDILIKLGLGFSNRMINILNPDRTQKTYNSYGKLKR